ncbi:MAG: hypothetical protein ABSG50_03355 [Opitutaceae bacterium]|jgi:hypothetical protein
MNLFSGSMMMRTKSPKLSIMSTLGLFVTGGLLLAGIGWVGLEQIVPASTAVESIDPVMPLLPLTIIYLLNLQP